MRGVPSTCELRKDVNISMWFLFLLMWNSPDDVSMEKSWIFSLFSIWIVLRWQVWKKVDAIKWYQIQGLYTEDMIVQIKFGNAYVSTVFVTICMLKGDLCTSLVKIYLVVL